MINLKQVTLKDGRKIELFELSNNQGMSVEIMSLGGIIKSIKVPDKEGRTENVILSFKDIDDYIENPSYIGAIIGRVAGRIYKGEVTLEGKKYQLALNEGPNHLHGGMKGIDKKVWEYETSTTLEGEQLVLRCTTKHLEEGYPGNVNYCVTYTLTHDNILKLRYEATTDHTTLVNMTNHAYFNLSGNLKHTINNHQVTIASDYYTPLDKENIIIGEPATVMGTKFDFNKKRTLEEGYDHGWVLAKGVTPQMSCYDPVSGRKLEITTDQKAVVMYTMIHPISVPKANGDWPINQTALGVCFETQGLPIGYNEINKEAVILKPGDTYKQETSWRFSIED